MTPGWELSTHIGELTFRKADAQAAKQTFNGTRKRCGATKAVDVNPIQGAFNITDGKLIAPGDPFRSVLYYRVSKTGPGRMPHIGSDVVDNRGVKEADADLLRRSDFLTRLLFSVDDPKADPAILVAVHADVVSLHFG